MADQRFIIEMGMGNDLHGENYTKAATRAVENARQRSSLHILSVPGIKRDALRIVVTIGVQAPEQVDPAAIAALFGDANVTVRVEKGGLNSRHPETGQSIVMAAAAIEAFLPAQR